MKVKTLCLFFSLFSNNLKNFSNTICIQRGEMKQEKLIIQLISTRSTLQRVENKSTSTSNRVSKIRTWRSNPSTTHYPRISRTNPRRGRNTGYTAKNNRIAGQSKRGWEGRTWAREREEKREAGSVAGANQIPGRVTGDPMMPRPWWRWWLSIGDRRLRSRTR